ncbi:MAG: beta-ketoacyl-ACP synthase [Cellvibrionaceae bacterium]|nr:beta-ketoacyl-ACP synthase [Cellvibrionaceae bacterium]
MQKYSEPKPGLKPESKPEPRHRVAITGAGTVSALGNNWQEVRKTLQRQQSAVRYMHEWEQFTDMHTRLAAPIDHFALPQTYSTKKKRSMGRVAQFAVRATELALAQAGLTDSPLVRSEKTGVAYGSATGSSNAALEFFHLLENQSTDKINSSTYIRMMSHTGAINISVYFGTQGRMYTTSSACTAGSQGIGYAYEAIRCGQQTLMIAGGAEELCPTQAAVFDTIFAASTRNQSPQSTPRPFDTERDGLVLGEGACTLILESWEHARARGAPILGEVIGYATNTDGAHLVRPNQVTMARVMGDCLNDAAITSEAVGYICAHGTATEHGDIAEATATLEVMGKTPISSLKSYTGHTLGACGAFEAWASVMMMQDQWFAPTLNLEKIDSRCAGLDYIQQPGRALDTDIVMSNNFAFGGVNTSLLFKKVNDP